MKKSTLFLTIAITFTLPLYLLVKSNTDNHDIHTEKPPNYTLQHSVETQAKKSTVWKLWSDVENWKKFNTELEYSYLKGTSEFEAGSMVLLKKQGSPKIPFTLTQVKEMESFVGILKLPLRQSIEVHHLLNINENRLTTITLEAHFKGKLKCIYYLLMKNKINDNMKRIANDLKHLAENETRATQNNSNL